MEWGITQECCIISEEKNLVKNVMDTRITRMLQIIGQHISSNALQKQRRRAVCAWRMVEEVIQICVNIRWVVIFVVLHKFIIKLITFKWQHCAKFPESTHVKVYHILLWLTKTLLNTKHKGYQVIPMKLCAHFYVNVY